MSIAERLKFGSKLHALVSDGVYDRIMLSYNKMSKYYERMAKAEELYTAYLPEREIDRARRQKRDNEGLPQYTTLQVPYTYAQVLSAHTYITSVFLSRNPVLQFAGRHGEAENNVMAVEALMDYQLMVGRMLAPLYIWLLDPAKYGFGVIGYYWDQKTTRVRKTVARPVTVNGLPVMEANGQPKLELTETFDDVIGYEGNSVYNVRPQDWFPDPRVPLWRMQEGEFVARYVEIPWNEIQQGARDGSYFNLDAIKEERASNEAAAQEPLRDEGGRNSDVPGTWAADSDFSYGRGPRLNRPFLKAHEIFIKLIPDEWGLADGDREEIWVIRRTRTGVVISATPLGEYHGQFPFGILEWEPDGYNVTPRGMVETVKPMNDIMTWLINTHFYNVRSALNNSFVVDPSMVVMKDLTNPAPGKLIRLKPEMFGRDVRTAITQLQVGDVTRGHIADMQIMAELMQRVTGVNDQIMGVVNNGGRKTAQEVRTNVTFGVNRLKTICEYFSAMGMGPLMQLMLQTTQQHYTMQKSFRIVGDMGQFATSPFVEVDGATIAGFYDYVPVDGTLPIDRYAQANLWGQLLAQMAQVPQVMMQYDLGKIFGWVAQLSGIKNINQFRVQTLAPGQAPGPNVVPLNAGPSAKDMGRPPLMLQNPGMGPTS